MIVTEWLLAVVKFNKNDDQWDNYPHMYKQSPHCSSTTPALLKINSHHIHRIVFTHYSDPSAVFIAWTNYIIDDERMT